MAGVRVSSRVLALSLSLLLALWVPAPAHSRCPNQKRESGNSSEVEGSGLEEGTSHVVSVELSQRRELPPGCTEDMGMEEEEREFDSTVYLARLEFHRVETIFTILVFIMVVVLAKMGELRVWNGRQNLPIQLHAKINGING